MFKIARVKEDDLQELNLGTLENPKIVKISVHVEGQFKIDLNQLLMEFKDIFAWQYTHMKGVDSSFCMHKINLKKMILQLFLKDIGFSLNQNQNFWSRMRN